MPKYIVEYGLDVPAYGEVEIDVDSEDPQEIAASIRKLHEQGELVDEWETRPDVGCDNYRVVSVRHQPTSENIDDDYFSLENRAGRPLGQQPHPPSPATTGFSVTGWLEDVVETFLLTSNHNRQKCYLSASTKYQTV